MAIKVSKEQWDELQGLRTKLGEKYTAFHEARMKARDLGAEYYDFRTEVVEKVNEIASDLRSEFEDKSDRWKESDAGQAADEFITAWENVEVEEAELPDGPEDDPFENELEKLEREG